MALPDSAEPYWQQQQATNAAAVAIALRAWQSSDGDEGKWLALLPLLMRVLVRAQGSSALAALTFIETAVRELSLATSPLAGVDPAPLLGVSGAGLPLRDLYAQLPEQYRLHAAQAARARDDDETTTADVQPLTPTEMRQQPDGVLRDADAATVRQLSSSVQTLISDTGRAAESLAIAVRPGVGYVRMLNPPSCSRCVILAGKFYRWSDGFQRHPQCDCRHIPADEYVAGDLKVDPKLYFSNLTEAEQNATFGKASAQAIRDGADMSRVVNAYGGVERAQVFGQNLLVTRRGTGRRARRNPPRLMPSSIYQIADDRSEAIRLLTKYGYIRDVSTPDVVDLDALLARTA